MKKILFIISILITNCGIIYAQSTGDDQILMGISYNSQDLINLIDGSKPDLIKDINKINDFANDLYNETLKKIILKKEYIILKQLNEFKESSLHDILGTQLNDLVGEIIIEYNDLKSQLNLLNEKKELKLISNTDYDNKLIKLISEAELDAENFNNKVITLKNDIQSSIESILVEYEKEVVEEDNLLKSLLKKEEKLNTIVDSYSNFEKLVNKIRDLYSIKNDDIYAFVIDIKKITNNLLTEVLNDYADVNYNNNYYLDMYEQEIDTYIASQLNSYKEEFDDYFNELLGNFYSEQDYNFITSTYSDIKRIYFTGSRINYRVLQQDQELSVVYGEFNKRILSSTVSIQSNLDKLNNSDNVSELEQVLKEKINQFYEEVASEKRENLKTFISSKLELLKFKLTENKQLYNTFMTDYNSVMTKQLPNNEKINAYTSLISHIDRIKASFIDIQLKKDLMIMYWDLIIKRIDAKIIDDNLFKYGTSYPDIENRLEAILTKIQLDAELQGKEEVLKEKLETALGRIDSFVQDENFSDKQRYVLLKIKKIIIKFNYLNS